MEYQLKGVNQIAGQAQDRAQLRRRAPPIVRQDPDVIMVGEIRDLETAEISIQAALTGHLVFSTLHTNDAPGAITRLQDMGCEPYLFSLRPERGARPASGPAHLRGLPGPPRWPSPPSWLALGVAATGAARSCSTARAATSAGAPATSGRTGIYELLRINEEIRSLILRKASGGEIRRHAVAHGMVTLREDGWAKACAGVTTVAEILRVTQEET